MNVFEAIVLGFVQGVTEFLPVSSSGHLILVRDVLRVGVESGLAFDIMVHVATLLAVVVYFWRDLTRLAQSALSYATGRPVAHEERVRLGALIVATIPAAAVGALWGDELTETFRTPAVVAYALIGGSIVFWVAERVGRQNKALTLKRGLLVGIAQVCAFIPGTSRSGITIAGGLFAGLTRQEAARFSFLLALPIIAGAGLVQVLGDTAAAAGAMSGPVIVGGIVAFASGLAAIHGLLRFVQNHTLNTFIVYRLALAAVILIWLSL